MLLLLGILKRNHKYYMNVVNIEKESSMDDYQLINSYILNSCENVSVVRFLSNKQDPTQYLKGDFDIKRLIVDDEKLMARMEDYQIISIYYNEENNPCLYRAINRAGIISMHDVSEFEYTKNKSILGDDINKLPDFVEHKSLAEAYEYLNNNDYDKQDLSNMPVGLARHYLIGVKGFKEGYHTITRVNNGIELAVHEYMLFNGTATIKLVEYIPKDKNIFLTKQDFLTNPYPYERTVDFLPSSIVFLGNIRTIKNFFKMRDNSELTFYDRKSMIINIPFSQKSLAVYDKYFRAKNILNSWRVDLTNNISEDIYKNVLPNEIYKLPNRFYRDMKNTISFIKPSTRLEKENENVERWIHTVCLFLCWQYYTKEFKKRLQPIIANYQDIYRNALNNLVADLGPRDSLIVMKWTKEHLKKEMASILDSDIRVVDDNDCLFTFRQNDYDLPDNLKVYSEETISIYGGLDKLKEDFTNPNIDKKNYIIRTLEKIEKDLRANSNNLEIQTDITSSLIRVPNVN